MGNTDVTAQVKDGEDLCKEAVENTAAFVEIYFKVYKTIT